ncbi:hypothetical protein BXZ70DRAFT_190479 [Cristinia sonorae]|uniref:F-box domain-containing protein n=1 Tax=Cristinia sonorae TaxID=1940300 RepID=A0A8K0XPK6_9AGAR|nr:hypothetical protein BXZ70DRAFT_190479 [Cristinia sonorae]
MMSEVRVAVHPHVPLEIIDNILRNLKAHWIRDLASCALVCRAWCEFTRRHLFYELSFAFEVASPIDFLTGTDSSAGHTKTLGSLIHFLERSPQIRNCVQKLTLRRQHPFRGSLLPHVLFQFMDLLHPSTLPALRHLSLINVVFIRPFGPGDAALASDSDSSLVPPLDSLQVHLDDGREINGNDVLFLLSMFHSVKHLNFTGCPTIINEEDTDVDAGDIRAYRVAEPKVLTLTKLSCYIPFLRTCSPSLMKNLCVFTAGLFDIQLMDDADISTLQQFFHDTRYTCGDVTLYYTLLDRNDRCRTPDFSFFAPFVRTFKLQFSLYEEEGDHANVSIWALVAKVLSTLLPAGPYPTSPFRLHTVILKISGREQPVNWLPEMYDHADLIKGLELPGAARRARLVEDVLLRILETQDLCGDDEEEGFGGLVVRVTSHDHMPVFDSRIRRLIKGVFARLDATSVLCF